MAIKKTVLVTETTRAPLPRMQPAQGPGAVVQIPLETGSATLAPATAIGIVTASGLGAVFDQSAVDGTGAVYGFILNEVTQDGSDNVVANVMIQGMVHVQDVIDAATYPNTTAAQLRTDLRLAAVREKGLFIDGLDARDTTVST